MDTAVPATNRPLDVRPDRFPYNTALPHTPAPPRDPRNHTITTKAVAHPRGRGGYYSEPKSLQPETTEFVKKNSMANWAVFPGKSRGFRAPVPFSPRRSGLATGGAFIGIDGITHLAALPESLLGEARVHYDRRAA